MNYLSNAFSLNMLTYEHATVRIEPISLEEARSLCRDARSYVGHEPTRRRAEELLGYGVQFNRGNLLLTREDVLVVAQYYGPRLTEGATELPTGDNLRWVRVRLEG